MNIWTKENIINYTSDPDEANDKKYPKELHIAMRNFFKDEWGNQIDNSVNLKY